MCEHGLDFDAEFYKNKEREGVEGKRESKRERGREGWREGGKERGKQ